MQHSVIKVQQGVSRAQHCVIKVQHSVSKGEISVSNSTLPGIESVKKKSTAELRVRFPAIKALLQEGYTHKQICLLLNTAGMTISYPYYRVVMTRLRTEFDAAPIGQPTRV